jgi:hypothetical protein
MEENTRFDNWEQRKEAIRKEHPELTDEDLRYEIGKEGELLERLQAKLKKTKEEIRNWLHIMG